MNFFISRDKLIIWSVLCLVAVIIGTIIGFKVEDGGIGLYATLAIISLGICPYVKRFILFVGRNVIDFSTALDLILGATILIAGIYFTKELDINYWWFVLGALLYTVITALKNYVLYLLIDIRDSLYKIANGESKDTIQIPKDMKHCTNCGKLIKQTAKKCRYCGEWLNEENGEVK